ncbi:MAG: ferrous iron transporter B [bacterium]|nr:ferrous iron transporter B [bacterium]
MQSLEPPLIALAGSPNCGKTSLFNALTGLNQKVGNYPGITVDRVKGSLKLSGDQWVDLMDVPGCYSLDIHSFDEKVGRDILLGRFNDEKKPSAIVAVIDATNLRRSLYLVIELQQLGCPVIVALNMMDEAHGRGLELDLAIFERELGCPIIPTVATKRKGIDQLKEKIQIVIKEGRAPEPPENFLHKIRRLDVIKATYTRVEEILRLATVKEMAPDTLTAKIDRWVLHPVWGLLILIGFLIFVFQLMFSWAGPVMDLVETGVTSIQSLVLGVMTEGLLQSFLVDGVIAGVGNFLVFLPQIMLLFLFLLFLEDWGYLGRAAFLLDGWMRKMGLPGRATVPLLSSHACAIPGIMAARTLESRSDRLAVMMVAPLTQCSARLPVYAILIAAFVPSSFLFGFLNLQGLVLFSLYTLGMLSALIMSYAMRKTVLTGSPSGLLMELPPYRIPQLSNVLRGVWQKSWSFVKKAGTVILVLSMILWVLVSFPRNADGSQSEINKSYAAQVGQTIQPVFEPLGFDWRLSTILIPAFGARELAVAAMGTVLSVQMSEDDPKFEGKLTEMVRKSFAPEVLMALLIWFVFAPQCISTFAVLVRETGGYKWPFFVGLYTIVLAYLGALSAKYIAQFIIT